MWYPGMIPFAEGPEGYLAIAEAAFARLARPDPDGIDEASSWWEVDDDGCTHLYAGAHGNIEDPCLLGEGQTLAVFEAHILAEMLGDLTLIHLLEKP